MRFFKSIDCNAALQLAEIWPQNTFRKHVQYLTQNETSRCSECNLGCPRQRDEHKWSLMTDSFRQNKYSIFLVFNQLKKKSYIRKKQK